MSLAADLSASHDKMMRVLESGRRYTSGRLAREAGLDSGVVNGILGVVESTLGAAHDGTLVVSHRGGTTSVQMKKSVGLAGLPQDERHAFIRGQYPEPSGEQAALVRLLLDGRSAAASPGGKLLKGLAGAGYVSRRGGRLCLTELGEYAARGTLSIYPELEKAPADARPTGGAGRRAGARSAPAALHAGRGGSRQPRAGMQPALRP